MDPEERLTADAWTWTKSSLADNQPFTDSNSRQEKWENSSFLDYELRMEQQFSDFHQPSEAQNSRACNDSKTISPQGRQMSEAHDSSKILEWDPRAMLNNLSFMEKKIHKLRDLVCLIVGRRDEAMGRSDGLLAQQQHLITADLTSIIVQLISTAGSLLASFKHTHISENSMTELQPPSVSGNIVLQQADDVNKVEDWCDQNDISGYQGAEENCTIEDHEMKSDDDADDPENLPPGSYQIVQLGKEEILAPHTHFCMICGKGFKRDANLRMHMRGHGDEYKTLSALAKPNKESSSEPMLVKRYSCPYLGCKRNKDHKKFQPLKTILCVKNHYKRTHCDKTYICSRCNMKKFSVIADLRTHEKHCGRDRWLCSCGTTFCRKDKLFGHVALFQGHTPAIPLEESSKESARPSDQGQCSEATYNVQQQAFNFRPNAPSRTSFQNATGGEGTGEDPASYFASLSFDKSSIDGYHEFPRPPFDDSGSSFSFMLPDSCDYPPENGRCGGSNNLDQ